MSFTAVMIAIFLDAAVRIDALEWTASLRPGFTVPSWHLSVSPTMDVSLDCSDAWCTTLSFFSAWIDPVFRGGFGLTLRTQVQLTIAGMVAAIVATLLARAMRSRAVLYVADLLRSFTVFYMTAMAKGTHCVSGTPDNFLVFAEGRQKCWQGWPFLFAAGLAFVFVMFITYATEMTSNIESRGGGTPGEYRKYRLVEMLCFTLLSICSVWLRDFVHITVIFGFLVSLSLLLLAFTSRFPLLSATGSIRLATLAANTASGAVTLGMVASNGSPGLSTWGPLFVAAGTGGFAVIFILLFATTCVNRVRNGKLGDDVQPLSNEDDRDVGAEEA
jgi:hypothetical protein